MKKTITEVPIESSYYHSHRGLNTWESCTLCHSHSCYKCVYRHSCMEEGCSLNTRDDGSKFGLGCICGGCEKPHASFKSCAKCFGVFFVPTKADRRTYCQRCDREWLADLKLKGEKLFYGTRKFVLRVCQCSGCRAKGGERCYILLDESNIDTNRFVTRVQDHHEEAV